MRTTLVLVLPLAACFAKPELGGGTPHGDAPDPDAAGADSRLDAPTTCLFDSFDTGFGACAPWGTGVGNADFTTPNGVLTLAPAPLGPNNGGCFEDPPGGPFTAGGIAMEVLGLPNSAASGYVELMAFDGATNPLIIAEGGPSLHE